MPTLLWIVLSLLLISGTLFGLSVLAKADAAKYNDEGRLRDAVTADAASTGMRRASWITAGLAVLGIGLSSLAVVPANEVGIATRFGAWSGTMNSGLNVVAPWTTVDTFPTRNQKSIRDRADGNDACIPVKLAGGAGACVDATVLYTIDDSAAEKLWRGWGSFEKLNMDLINRSTDDAAGYVYGGYTAEAASSGENRQKITEGITTRLRDVLHAAGVRLESVTLGDIHLPSDVQARINGILEQDAKVEIAKRREAEAQAQARANAALQQSLTPEALVKLCLDAARDIKPQVFNCMGGAASPSVILPAR